MQIHDQVPGELSLHTRPNHLFTAAGVVLVGMGLFGALMFGKVTQLTCTRTGANAGTFELRESSLRGTRLVTRIPLKLLVGAEVVPHAFQGANYHQLDLILNDGYDAPFHLFWYGSGAEARADADRLMAFRRTPGLSAITLERDRRPFFFGVGALIAALGGLFGLWGSQSLRATFSRGAGQVTVRRESWLGVREAVYPLGAIASFDVGGIRQDCNLFMVLRSGQRVALSASSDLDATGGPRRVRAQRQGVASRVAAFCAAGERRG
jgi:hypothetical protein